MAKKWTYFCLMCVAIGLLFIDLTVLLNYKRFNLPTAGEFEISGTMLLLVCVLFGMFIAGIIFNTNCKFYEKVLYLQIEEDVNTLQVIYGESRIIPCYLKDIKNDRAKRIIGHDYTGYNEKTYIRGYYLETSKMVLVKTNPCNTDIFDEAQISSAIEQNMDIQNNLRRQRLFRLLVCVGLFFVFFLLPFTLFFWSLAFLIVDVYVLALIANYAWGFLQDSPLENLVVVEVEQSENGGWINYAIAEKQNKKNHGILLFIFIIVAEIIVFLYTWFYPVSSFLGKGAILCVLIFTILIGLKKYLARR